MILGCILAVVAAKPSGILAPVVAAADAEIVDTYQTSPVLRISSYSAPSSSIVLPAAATSYSASYQEIHHHRSSPIIHTYTAPVVSSVPVVRTVYHQSSPLVHHTISSPTFLF